MAGKCRKCACAQYRWNAVSATQKFFSGGKISGSLNGRVVGAQASLSGLPLQDNKSQQTAYRNCLCGHHQNYHA